LHISLKGQVALVTGAGRGIGRTIALMLGRAGAHVLLTARTSSQLRAAADEIRAGGAAADFHEADLAGEADIVRLFGWVKERCARLDILINNAGIGRFGPLAEVQAEDLDRQIAVNLRGTFLCCREAMRLMIPQRAGYIINISSVVGFRGYASQSVYAATKHGVMGLTKSLAVEAQAHGIRVSAVLPGGVDTEMVRQSRPDLAPQELLQPEDVAQTVAFLLSLSDRAAVDEIYVRRRNSKPF
jgi:3-oxoacyl-[acyl-carrier protein] reductase